MVLNETLEQNGDSSKNGNFKGPEPEILGNGNELPSTATNGVSDAEDMGVPPLRCQQPSAPPAEPEAKETPKPNDGAAEVASGPLREEEDRNAVDEEGAIFKDGQVVIHIRAYEKRSEGFNAYLVYKIETRVRLIRLIHPLQVTNIPNYSKAVSEVWRRFSDFLGLHDKLAEKYQSKGVAVPPAPEKSLSALTKTKLNSANDDTYTK